MKHTAVSRIDFTRKWLLSYLLFCALWIPLTAPARAQKSALDALQLPLPISMEIGQSFSPWSQNVLLADSYRIATGPGNTRLQFSNQGPAFWGGSQFKGLPGGYQLADLTVARKPGTFYAFRTVNNIERIVRPDAARTLTGAGIEIPKAIFGTRFSGYFLHGSPGEQARIARWNSLGGHAGSQFGGTVTRPLGKSARLQVEFAQSRYHLQPPSPGNPWLAHGGRNGLWMRLEGTVAKNGLNLTMMDKQEGLANPAMPGSGPGRRGLWFQFSRRVKNHQLQYSSQADVQSPMAQAGIASRRVHQQTVQWSYRSKYLPAISAMQTWNRQLTGMQPEIEGTWRVALDKSLKRLNSAVSWSGGRRSDALSAPIWDRRVLSGDADISVSGQNRLHFRYERSGFQQHATAQRIDTDSLQVDTRIAFMKNRISLAPVLNVRRVSANWPALAAEAARFTLSAQIKLPNRIPGTDLSIYFGANRVRAAGQAQATSTDFTMRWNFKRI